MFYAVELFCKDDGHQLNINKYGTAVHAFESSAERDDWVHDNYGFRNWAKSSDAIVRRACQYKNIYDGVPYIEGGQLLRELTEEYNEEYCEV